MNLIKDIIYYCLTILIFITNSICFDKYIHFTKCRIGYTRFDASDILSTKEYRTVQFDGFNTTPQVLLGMYYFSWAGFSDYEHEFNLSIELVDLQQFKAILSTTTQSMKNINHIMLKYILFESNEALIYNIKINEQNIISMSSNVNQPKIRQLKKLFTHQLSKKPYSKRSVSCFILGYRQEYSTSPPKSDQMFSFFVESIGEFNENEYQLTFTTLDQQNTIKWVNLTCIEYYQYDQYFQPDQFIYTIEENKQISYSLIKSSDSYIQRQLIDLRLETQVIQQESEQIFYGFNGMDLLFNGSFYLEYRDKKFYYYETKCRAGLSTFILFKMNNCPKNCEDCVNSQTCQKCKLKFTLNNQGVCVECKKNCLTCDSNLNCKTCEEPYYYYKGECYLDKPKRTYCVSRPFYN